MSAIRRGLFFLMFVPGLALACAGRNSGAQAPGPRGAAGSSGSGSAGATPQGSSTPAPDPGSQGMLTIPLDPNPEADGEAAPPAGSTTRPGAARPPDYAPDPAPLSSANQYEFEFRFARGDVTVVGSTARHFAKPVATARRLGRFAVELWLGAELVERVRFDFPLLAATSADTGKPSSRSLESGLVVTAKVLVPQTDRPTRAALIDRATGKQWPLRWPPETAPEMSPKANAEPAPSRPSEAAQ